jgi:peptide/nickel transport system permease protein
MLGFLLRRCLGLLLVLVVLHGAIFWAMELIPGDPVHRQLGEHATPEAQSRLRRKLGLDQPAVHRYGLAVRRTFLHLDLGLESDGVYPVASVLRDRFPATCELGVAAMLIATTLGMLLGILAAVRRRRWLDTLAMTGSTFGVAMPIFWLGLMLLMAASAVGWRHLGGGLGYGEQLGLGSNFIVTESLLRGRWDLLGVSLQKLLLPAVTLATVPMAFVVRMTRASVVEVLGEDYIRTARAKGLPARRVVLRHALRNALVPIVTIVGLQLGYLLGGAVITETVFDWKGVGSYVVDRAIAQDANAVGGCVFLMATIFLVVNLVVDLSYVVIDPRLREGRP